MLIKHAYKMVERSQLRELVINNVIRGDVIGKGASGKIFKGTWEGAPCAIKEIHSIFAELASEKEFTAFKLSFIEECRRSSQLRHPNIVQFLGVYFRAAGPHGLPCLVMELLHSDLTTFLSNNPVISYGIKLSILNDVALALRFLHSSSPPIIHRDLSSNNVLISRGYVAKIGDLGTARFLNPNREEQLSRMSQMTKAPGTVDFMSPEVLFDNPQYGTPLDVFSFACVSLHTITHQWPTPTAPVYTDPTTKLLLPRSEVERRTSHFNKFDKEMHSLKQLLTRCLKNDPKARPAIVEVCDSLVQLSDPKFQIPLPSMSSAQPSTSSAQPSISSAQPSTSSAQPSTSSVQSQPDIGTTYWNQLKKVWSKCATFPEREQVDTIAAIDGEVYAKGNCQNCTFHYCSAKDTWSTFPTLSLYGYSLACVPATKHLLAIGGVNVTKKITGQVNVFNVPNECWCDDSITSKMKVPRYSATSVGYQSSVIVVGGLVDVVQSTTQTVEILKVIPENLSSSYWSVVQSMPFGASVPMTTIINDTLYVAGGYTLNASMCYMTSVSISDLLSSKDGASPNRWSDVSSLPCSTSSFTSYKGQLLIFGGDYIKGASNKQYSWEAVSSIYIYHSEKRQWEKVGKIPCDHYLGRCGHLTPSKIIFIGGQTNVSSTSTDDLVTQCITLNLDDSLQSAESIDTNAIQKGLLQSAALKSCRQQ